MAPITLHLRSETKPLEHRSALTPNVVRKLLDKGLKVNVERSPERIFDDAEFESAGATLVPEGSWPNVPEDHIIIGLKEVRTLENTRWKRLTLNLCSWRTKTHFRSVNT